VKTNASDLPDESLFEQALRCRTPDERATLLDRACAGQPELRHKLEQLLEAYVRAGEFLEHGVGAGSRPCPVGVEFGDEEERPGTLIGRYKLLQKIGEGGMGVVYMAEQAEPVIRKVALKIIKLGMDTKQVVARFEAERQALALMDHPNIAKVLDAGATETGRPYFVMELVHGVPITEYCDTNQLPTQQRLELFIPVCQAIQHAHQKGIIHRDIKPSNVMVTLHDGVPVPKVIDFGVAKAINQRLTEKTLFTHYAQMIGTPAYMSPEQAEMSGLDIDTRSDVYSLGVLLYELLTGTTPFDVKELLRKGYAEMQRVIAEQEPPKPSTRMSTLTDEQRTVVASRRSTEASALRKVLQGDLDWIVLKCLEKDRTRRYETSNGLAADLRRHLNNELITACAPTTGYLIKKLIKRNQAAFSVAAVVFAGILLALGVFIYATIHVTRERNEKDLALRERGVAMDLAAKRASEVQEQLFQSLCSQARAHRYSRRVGQRSESLAALAQAARIRPDAQLRDQAIATLALPDLQRGPDSEYWVPETRIFAFDDRYQRYAQLGKDGRISVFAQAGEPAFQWIPSSPATEGWHLRLSPDGEFVAKLEEQRRLRVWRVADGRPVLQVEPPGCSELAFTHDSRRVAVGQTNVLRLFDLAGGAELYRWRVHTNIYRLAFDPENRRIAVGYSRFEVTSIYNADDGSLVADLPVGLTSGQIVAWHPHGEHLAVAGSDTTIKLWSIASRQQIARLAGHVQQITELTFHPLSGLLASHSWDGTLRLWEPWSGREVLQNPGQAWIRFSSDGQRLGLGWAGQSRYHLWEAVPSKEYRTLNSILPMGTTGLYNGDISPDGRWLAIATQAGVQISEIATGRIVAHLPTGPGASALFLHDGRSLVLCTETNLQCWAFATAGLDRPRLGPARTLQLPFKDPVRLSLTPDSSRLAVVSETAGQAVILETASDFQPVTAVAHEWAGSIAISGDSRWLATSGWNIDTVRLWDAQTGQMARELTGRSQSRVFFTPDNRELVICQGDGFTFWDLKTGQLNRRISAEVALFGSYVAFSHNGRMMALPVAPGVVELKEVATTRTVARLEDPFGDRSGWVAFTPDDRALVVAAGYGRVIHVWELDAIRQQLASMGLASD
jgi:serine/threonine protein kinase/WD40 repeat protein